MFHIALVSVKYILCLNLDLYVGFLNTFLTKGSKLSRQVMQVFISGYLPQDKQEKSAITLSLPRVHRFIQ